MKIIEATFFETFTVHTLDRWKKIGFKAEIHEGDDIRQCLYKMQKHAEDFFFESAKAAEKQKEAERPPSLNDVASIIRDIGTVEDLTVLKAYALISKTDPDIKAAYNKKFDQLQKDLHGLDYV